jgi:hypothetical protein
MTDQNGWPDASKPGYPANPEREGAHVLDAGPGDTGERRRIVALWAHGRWHLGADYYVLARDAAGWRWQYVGPCHTPAEVAALVEKARREEREAVGARLAVALDLLARRDMTCAGCCGPSSSEDEYEGYLAEVTKEVDAAIRKRGDA